LILMGFEAFNDKTSCSFASRECLLELKSCVKIK
jgi:hypothetical protein